MALKKRSKETLDVYIKSKNRLSQTDAYLVTHPNAKRRTANDLAAKLFNKPDAKIYLQEHVNKAKSTIVSLLDDEKSEIRLKSAVEILDRNEGKATQRTEVTSQGIQINIDLTQALPE